MPACVEACKSGALVYGETPDGSILSDGVQFDPLVVDVEGETHKLTGSAEEQYTKWRALLKQIYAAETGLVDSGE